MARRTLCSSPWILSPAWQPWCQRRASTSHATTASLRRITGCVNIVTPAKRGRRKTEATGDPPPARHVSMTWRDQGSAGDQGAGALLICLLSRGTYHSRCGVSRQRRAQYANKQSSGTVLLPHFQAKITALAGRSGPARLNNNPRFISGLFSVSVKARGCSWRRTFLVGYVRR